MRLALCRPDRVGDVILATACLEPIRRQLPSGARLFFLARESMRPLLEAHLLLDGFLPLPDPTNDPAAGRLKLARALEALRLDALVHLHPDRVCQLAGRDANVPRRIGYRRFWTSDFRTLTEGLPDRRHTGTRHEAECNFAPLVPLGIRLPRSVDELRPRVALPERGRRDSLGSKIPAGPFLVLNPTAHALDLRWPAAHFAGLATELARLRPDHAIVLVADRAEDPSIVEIRRLLGITDGTLPPWLVDLAGQTDLGELALLLRDARALVTRNTGTSHLAAAVGCPLVELFGRAEPAYGPTRWRALGDPARTVTLAAHPGPRRFGEGKRAFWRRGHASITPAEVLAALLPLI